MDKKIGKCHLCGEEKELTREHIPPKCCFNNDKTLVKESIYDDGFWIESLCAECNSKTGKDYVSFYKQFCMCFASCMMKYNPSNLNDGGFDFIECTIKNISPIKVVKQILAMFCSLLNYETIQKFALDKIVLNKSCVLEDLENQDFDILMALTTEKNGGICKETIITTNLGNFTFACINAFPFKIIFINKSNFEGFVPYRSIKHCLERKYELKADCTFTFAISDNDYLSAMFKGE